MKLHHTIIASAIIMLACNSTASTSNNKSEFNADKEQQNIMAVIEKETTSFFARDYEGWKGTRAQQAYDFQGWNNADGTFEVENGWQDVNADIKKYIQNDSIPIQAKPEILRKNIMCKFYADTCAYLTWDEYTREDSSKVFFKSKDLRLMEKQNGEWKIVTVASFWDYKNKFLRENIQ